MKINYINDKKQKKIYLRIVFLNEYKPEEITSYSLLCNMLSNSSKDYQTKKQIFNRNCKLYNPYISFQTRSFYKTRITSASLSFVMPTYLKNINSDKYIASIIDYFLSFLLNPNIKNKKFKNKNFNEEKQYLKSEINDYYNQIENYAFYQFIKEMADGEIVSYNPDGNLMDLDKITEESLYNTYLDLLYNSSKEIYILGSLDRINVDLIKDKLLLFTKIPNKDLNLQLINEEIIICQDIKRIIKTRNISQSRMLLGFRTDINIKNELYLPFTIFVNMLGSLSTSTLFIKIREEEGLCYEIESYFLEHAKIMVVELGLDYQNAKFTEELIQKDISNYQNGIIDENLLESAKLEVIKELILTSDSASDTIDFIMERKLIGYNNDLSYINTLINKIKNITKEEIIGASKHIKLDTVFLLKGEGNE